MCACMHARVYVCVCAYIGRLACVSAGGGNVGDWRAGEGGGSHGTVMSRLPTVSLRRRKNFGRLPPDRLPADNKQVCIMVSSISPATHHGASIVVCDLVRCDSDMLLRYPVPL
jgi:hypothetical protein